MIDEIRIAEADAIERAAKADSLEALAVVDREILGKRSTLTGYKRRMGELSADERRTTGAALNAARDAVRAAVEARRTELSLGERTLRLASERLDLTEVRPS